MAHRVFKLYSDSLCIGIHCISSLYYQWSLDGELIAVIGKKMIQLNLHAVGLNIDGHGFHLFLGQQPALHPGTIGSLPAPQALRI